MQRSLLIGCGNSRVKKVQPGGSPEWVGELVTIDMDPNCGADIVMNLDGLGARSLRHPWKKRLPFPDAYFDELAAYDVLEHFGVQGDWRGWFLEMAEFHRVLKPNGLFGIIVPIEKDAFADPGHTRFFSINHFAFLSQDFYDSNIKKGTSATDYRWFWKLNFNIYYVEQQGNHHLAVLLKKTR